MKLKVIRIYLYIFIMAEIITKIYTLSNDTINRTFCQEGFGIETIKDNRKWYAKIGINLDIRQGCIIKPGYSCQVLLNEEEITIDYCENTLLGKKIVNKIQTQIDEHTDETSQNSVSHLTKLEFVLSGGNTLGFRICEVYDKRLQNYYIHDGIDGVLT